MESLRKQGFTLIELLVVVAILSMLMSVMTPSLRRAKDAAKEAQCMTQLRELGLAMQMYSSESRDTLPSSETWVSHAIKTLNYSQPENSLLCRRETMPPFLFCPFDTDPYPKPYMTGEMEVSSYCVNGAATDYAMGSGRRIELGLFGGSCRVDTVRMSSTCMMLGETTNYGKIADLDHPAAVEAFEAVEADIEGARTRFHHRSTSGFYHKGDMAVCFLDGHVGPVSGRKVETLSLDYWPGGSMMSDDFTFYPNLSLPTATENPAFWGPPYYDWEDRHD